MSISLIKYKIKSFLGSPFHPVDIGYGHTPDENYLYVSKNGRFTIHKDLLFGVKHYIPKYEFTYYDESFRRIFDFDGLVEIHLFVWRYRIKFVWRKG